MTKLTPRAGSCGGAWGSRHRSCGGGLSEEDEQPHVFNGAYVQIINNEVFANKNPKPANDYIVCPARNTHNIIRNFSDPKDGSDNSSNSSRVCTFVSILPGAMALHRMSWAEELELHHEWYVQIGADNSLVWDHEPVLVIRPDALFGQIEEVDYFHGPLQNRIQGQMAVDGRDFCAVDVISTLRGPVFTAVKEVQRAFRRKRYVKWYTTTGWNIFVKDVVAWIHLECRYFRKRKHDPFGESVMPTWGYVPPPAVAEGRYPLLVPALGRRRPADSTGSINFTGYTW